MAKDDYAVIVYKLLRYLYDCLKNGVRPSNKVLNAEFFGINGDYWNYIIKNLYNDGYVEGVTVTSFKGKPDYAVIQPHFCITPKGIEYLEENTLLKKAKNLVTDLIPVFASFV